MSLCEKPITVHYFNMLSTDMAFTLKHSNMFGAASAETDLNEKLSQKKTSKKEHKKRVAKMKIKIKQYGKLVREVPGKEYCFFYTICDYNDNNMGSHCPQKLR